MKRVLALMLLLVPLTALSGEQKLVELDVTGLT